MSGGALEPVRVVDGRLLARRLAEAFVLSRASVHTREVYRRALTGCSAPYEECPLGQPGSHRHRHVPGWLPWLEQRGIDALGGVRPATALEWIAVLQAAGYADASQALWAAAVSSWYRYLLREGVVAVNPVGLLDSRTERPRVRGEQVKQAALSAPETKRLVAAADAEGTQAGAVCALLFYCALRVGEIAGARWDDIGYVAGSPVLHIRGKGRKGRRVALPGPVMSRLLAHRDATPSTGEVVLPGQAGGAGAMFHSPGGYGPLSTVAVNRMLRRVGRRAGLDEAVLARLTSHAGRRTSATMLLGDGVALQDVQRHLGHSDPRTTLGYDAAHLDPARSPAHRMAALVRDPAAAE